MKQCPNCGSTQKKHDEVACSEYEAWLDRRDFAWTQEPPPSS